MKKRLFLLLIPILLSSCLRLNEKRFLEAAKTGNTNYIEKYHSQGGNLFVQEELNGYTAYHLAADYSQPEILKLLLEYDSSGLYIKASLFPIEYAAMAGCIECIEIITQYDPNLSNYGTNQLDLIGDALWHDEVETARYLFDIGLTTDYNNTDFYIARNQYDAMEMLIEYGWDINALDQNNTLPLEEVIENSRFESYLESGDWLIEHGGGIYATNREGKPILYLALEEGSLELLDFFLSNDADLAHPMPDGKTILEAFVENENFDFRYMGGYQGHWFDQDFSDTIWTIYTNLKK